MKLSELNPASDLKAFLIDKGINITIYSDHDKPTSGLPSEFIDILPNGSINRMTSDSKVYGANLALSINVKLLSKDEVNLVKQNSILKNIEEALESSNRFFLSQNTIFSGKSIASKYSYKTINITTKIY